MKLLIAAIVLIGGNKLDNDLPSPPDVGQSSDQTFVLWDDARAIYDLNYGETNKLVIGVYNNDLGQTPAEIKRVEYSLNGGPWIVADKVEIKDIIYDRVELRAVAYPFLGKPIVLEKLNLIRYKTGDKWWWLKGTVVK